MAKRLAVVDGADQGATFLLNDTGLTTIGSSRRHCDICLTAEGNGEAKPFA